MTLLLVSIFYLNLNQTNLYNENLFNNNSYHSHNVGTRDEASGDHRETVYINERRVFAIRVEGQLSGFPCGLLADS